MHVLVTADAVGGVWTYARELVTGLVRRGVRVTLVSFGDIPTAAQTEWMDSLRGLDYRPTAFRLEWMQEAEQDIEVSTAFLKAVIDETKPDVLHLNQYCYGSLDIDVPKLVVAHSDVVSWWVAVKGEEPKRVSWLSWYRQQVGLGLAGADAVVAPSRWMLQQIEQWYGKPRQGSVIYNGRTPTLFNPHMSKDEFVLSVGRLWDGGKNAALLGNVETTWPIFILGAEQHADQSLRGDARVLDENSPKVHVKGVQSEAQLRHWYGRAAIYAATSKYEPFGLAPLEAALSRCVVLANDIPSFREIWGESAYYYERNNAASLSEAIARLSDDRELRLTYANLAYNRARHRYTADRMVEDYMNLYQALVNAEAIAA